MSRLKKGEFKLIELLIVIIFICGNQVISAKLVDYTILPTKINPERINKKVIPPSTFYIDFESGNDNNPGTKEKPWKHHPWDINAKGNPAQTAGLHKYVFKKGVVYRGSLVPDESGTEKNPIVLTSEKGWGEGRALLLASERIKTKWKKCTKEQYPEFFPNVVDKIWQTDWTAKFEPRTMLELVNGKVIPLYKAREPDWKPWDKSKGDDVKKDFFEAENCNLELKVTIRDTSGFKEGDLVEGAGKWEDKDEDKANAIKGSTIVTQVAPGYIKILIKNLKRGEFQKGSYITNGRKSQKILKLSGGLDIYSYIRDRKHFSKYENFPASLWKGGVVWAEDIHGSEVNPGYIDKFDPSKKELITNFHRSRFVQKYSRYYIENIPFLLDECGEFYYSPKRKKLFVILNDNRNPNSSELEAGRELFNIKIYNCSNISIENLSFSGCNEVAVKPGFQSLHWRGGLVNASILIRGNLKNISIKNCSFEHLPFGIVSATMSTVKSDLIENIEISNCRFESIGGPAIVLSSIGCLPIYLLYNGVKGRLRHVKIKDNYANNIGFRKFSIWEWGGAIEAHNAELAELAYNRVHRTAGSGIIVFAPRCLRFFHQDVPLQRILIHHNYVEDTLLASQDYGSIAMWKGGPCYIYSNVSVNPVGYKHVDYKKWNSKAKDWYRTSCFGVGIYADHGYKVSAFNNIIIGANNNCNGQFYSSCGWNEAAGFLNSFFNNTIYNFAIPIRKGMLEANRSKYLNNMALKIGLKFFRYDARNIEFDTLAFADNVLQGNTKMFATVSAWRDEENSLSLSEWQSKLKQNLALAEQTGWIVDSPQVVDAKKHNFEPLPTSKAIDNAAKVFVPWGLYKVQGEWPFYKYLKDPSVIIDEHIYWNNDWFDSKKVRLTSPRNHLTAVNIDKNSYVDGTLEKWTKGALRLNGKNQYCKMTNTEKFNPGIGNFLIEAVFKTTATGPLAGKLDESGKGYQLAILPKGIISMILKWDRNKHLEAQCASKINDGKWRHLLVELDRKNEKGINIYIDGKKMDCEFSGKMQKLPLVNNREFTVGKNKDSYLKCDLDFLRVSRGNLKDAETSIDELYKWEFDGPFLKDFYGHKPSGKARDVGAIEHIQK